MTPNVSASRLSVLLPCRDAAAHLPQAIRSLQLQTFHEFEVVAVDDGSRDDTGGLLKSWARRDPRVRVLHLDGVGLPDALRVGSSLCRGEFIARLDADDVAHPRRLAEQIEVLSTRRELAAVGTRVRYFPHAAVGWGARRYQRWLNNLVEPEEIARDIFIECPIAHPTLTLRRAAFEAVGGYRANGWPEDYDLILRLHAAGARLANVPRVLHFWRERDDRASRTDPRYAPEAFRACKVHYLRQTSLAGRECVTLWGAGRVGKDFARALLDQGIRIRAFLDIDPRKIGQQIYGAPVRDAREVAREERGSYLLVAVGAAGARELIREELADAGFREPRDFRCVA
jgi:GT2 family glycosyltransferase